MDSHNFTHEEKLFAGTELYNWDNGLDWLYQVLDKKDCDKATALMIYWRADPNFYYSRYNSEADVPEGWQLEGYKLMKEAEKRLLENNFSETISYTPDEDRIPKDAAVLKKIPPQLLLPTKGTAGNVIIKNYIEVRYLIDACKSRGSLEEVKERLDKNPDLLNLCYMDSNPLIEAVRNYDKRTIPLVTFLLEKGADVKVQPLGSTSIPILFQCITCKSAKLIELLVKYGADINGVAPNGNNILHNQLAISPELWKNYFGPVFLKALLNLGANPEHKNTDGKTPIDLAKENNNEAALKVIEKFLKA
ncbi:DUF4274 domain-containing protein [Flavobacterium sp.]|uniref:DUF4274 domain-containing protein n=1 Tax=Flavobacterium sp. TaxID=239 RepID=UPI002605C57B|nr:DUF4274 domain-containing protein [Flavobacterium sp.]